MPGNKLQLGPDGRLRLKNDRLILAGAGDPCCCEDPIPACPPTVQCVFSPWSSAGAVVVQIEGSGRCDKCLPGETQYAEGGIDGNYRLPRINAGPGQRVYQQTYFCNLRTGFCAGGAATVGMTLRATWTPTSVELQIFILNGTGTMAFNGFTPGVPGTPTGVANTITTCSGGLDNTVIVGGLARLYPCDQEISACAYCTTAMPNFYDVALTGINNCGCRSFLGAGTSVSADANPNGTYRIAATSNPPLCGYRSIIPFTGGTVTFYNQLNCTGQSEVFATESLDIDLIFINNGAETALGVNARLIARGVNPPFPIYSTYIFLSGPDFLIGPTPANCRGPFEVPNLSTCGLGDNLFAGGTASVV